MFMRTETQPIGADSNGHWQLEKHSVMIFFKLVKAPVREYSSGTSAVLTEVGSGRAERHRQVSSSELPNGNQLELGDVFALQGLPR
jgi:hypothetical protein